MAVAVPLPLRSEDCEFTEPRHDRVRPGLAAVVHVRALPTCMIGLDCMIGPEQQGIVRMRHDPKLVFFQCPRLKVRCRSPARPLFLAIP